jgi:radical SAM protein
MTDPLPRELNHEESLRLIEEITEFGRPYPTLVFTGGDPLRRKDLFQLLFHASNLGLGFAVSPAVTELLTYEVIMKVKETGASSISFSIDGPTESTHDEIRRKEGTFRRTLDAVRDAKRLGLNVQVNTAIMSRNLHTLPEIFHLIRELGVKTWELFFVIKVGRASSVEDLTSVQCESVCNFLYDASWYGITIRTVEVPFIRRVAKYRETKGLYWNDTTYQSLRTALLQLDGEPHSPCSTLRPVGTLDGDGVIFVAHDGTVHPGGLLPTSLGNVRTSSLVRIYRENQLLKDIRQRKLKGPCGICEFKDICGGSRARAFSYYGDPLASDPACVNTWAASR